MSESEQKPQLGGSEAAVVRSSEKENAKRLFFGLQAYGYDAAQTLRQSQLAETADGLFLVQSGEGIVAQIAKSEQAAEARHQADQVIVKSFVLSGAAEFIA